MLVVHQVRRFVAATKKNVAHRLRSSRQHTSDITPKLKVRSNFEAAVIEVLKSMLFSEFLSY